MVFVALHYSARIYTLWNAARFEDLLRREEAGRGVRRNDSYAFATINHYKKLHRRSMWLMSGKWKFIA
jgi:hypothetical protein